MPSKPFLILRSAPATPGRVSKDAEGQCHHFYVRYSAASASSTPKSLIETRQWMRSSSGG